MPKRTFYIGRIFNIPIEIDFSWFYIFALLVWLLANDYFPGHYHQWPVLAYWIVSIVTAVLFFGSVLLHELGHSLVARAFHLPVEDIVLLIFGGVSKIKREPQSPGQELLIVLAGPLTNIALWALFYFAAPLFYSWQYVYALLVYLSYINFLLGIFNLIPGYPLDGGKALLAIVWALTHDVHKATLIAANVGRVFAFLFIVLGVFSFLNGDTVDGIWALFVGWLLGSAAASQTRRMAPPPPREP